MGGFDVMLVPTMPRLYTIAEVQADPVRLNSQLGTYTNFVNLLDLAAIAVPSGIRADGLPSSVTLIAPAGADGLIAGVAAAHPRPFRRADGRDWPLADARRIRAGADGTHRIVGRRRTFERLAAQSRANSNSAARFVREVETTLDYRLYALPGTTPPKPGLLRVADGEGAAIAAEIWSLDAEAFGAFVAKIPAPLGIGTLRLAGGGATKGFLVEADAVKGAEDISRFGGWRGYVASAAKR